MIRAMLAYFVWLMLKNFRMLFVIKLYILCLNLHKDKKVCIVIVYGSMILTIFTACYLLVRLKLLEKVFAGRMFSINSNRKYAEQIY